MEIKDRFNVLVQGARLAQSKGVLSLDDAVLVKTAIDWIESNTNLQVAAQILIKTAEIAQSKGIYKLRDAYMLFVAAHELDEVLEEEGLVEKPSASGTDREETEKVEA